MAAARHRVVALVSAPQATFELSCAAEVFGVARPGLVNPYEFEVCAETPGPIPTLAGYEMNVDAGLSALAAADTVVIPGWQRSDSPPSEAVLTALVHAHRRGARIVAICSGAFVLAEAGLLVDRRATTHWRLAASFAERYPNVMLDPDVLFVDHGDVATSAGTAAGIDLCLHLVRSDQGAAYAAQVARHMVMPPHREGGQLQYAVVPPSAPADTSLARVLEWAAARLNESLSVERMAARACVSPRTLARRFTEQLGVSPGQWLLSQRIGAARALLEETDLTIEAIADRVGLSSATNLRRRFYRAMRVTPTAYRRAFRLRHGVPARPALATH